MEHEKGFIKYPRTFHLPYSETITDDDKRLTEAQVKLMFNNQEVVITEKLDGENTSIYANGFHARSLDSKIDGTRKWLKQFQGNLSNDIPAGWRICGENMFAKHSIHYENLLSYFYGFAIYNENNICLSWEETTEWFDLLGIVSVPVLYQGKYDEKVIKNLIKTLDKEKTEGFVIRLTSSFEYQNFSQSVAKYVRANHNQCADNWRNSKIIQNQLAQ